MRKIEDVTLKDGRNLKEVLELHKKWLEDKEGGKRVDLSDEDLSYVDLKDIDLRCIFLRGTNLRGVNLECVNLKGADLKGAYLKGADLKDTDFTVAELSGANLTDAELSGANLSYANLTDVDLIGLNLIGAILKDVILIDADLRRADLEGANLTGAKLTGANLKDVKYNNSTSFFTLQCPEEGSFIGYKKANDKIVKLLITEDAKRSSATTRKCRCNKAKVLSITSLDGKKNFEKVNSDYDIYFIYEVGKVIEVKDFDDNRWNECSAGIHFFITREEAVIY